MISIAAYYIQTLLPVTLVLLAALFLFVVFIRKSASTKHFLSAAGIVCALLISLVPLLPTTARPRLPQPVYRQIQSIRPLTTVRTQPKAYRPHASVPPQANRLPEAALGIAIVSLLLGLRLVISLLAVVSLRKRSIPSPPSIGQMSQRTVRLVQNLPSPIAIGGFHPVILLPTEAEQWPEERIRAVLIHEGAHLDNGDPSWQILAEVACMIHWFNPLVWLVRNAMLREAERAADDSVIKAGIHPSQYAQELMDLAARVRRLTPLVEGVAFVRKGNVKVRIRSILASQIERRPMKTTMKFTAFASILLATYVTSAFAYPALTADHPAQNSPSFYKDIREGRTTAADRSNNFVGKLADGRSLEILQISRQMPDGTVTSWKPDGTPIPESSTIHFRPHKLKVLDTHTRYVIWRFPVNPKGSIDPQGSAGSGGSLPNSQRPSEMVFAGGGILSQKDGFVTVVSYIGTPKEDAAELPFGLSVVDGPYLDFGRIVKGDPKIANAEVQEVTAPHKGDLENEPWWKEHKAPYTMVTFDVSEAEGIGSFRMVPVFFDSGRTHKESDEFGSFGGYVRKGGQLVLSCRYYFAYPMSDVKEYRLQSRESLNIEVYGVRNNPNGI